MNVNPRAIFVQEHNRTIYPNHLRIPTGLLGRLELLFNKCQSLIQGKASERLSGVIMFKANDKREQYNLVINTSNTN